jgi:hypothetical protein
MILFLQIPWDDSPGFTPRCFLRIFISQDELEEPDESHVGKKPWDQGPGNGGTERLGTFIFPGVQPEWRARIAEPGQRR